MNERDLLGRIRLGEDSLTEFNGIANNGYTIAANDLAKALSSLANTRGGYVFLGVEDDGSVTGIGSTEEADALLRHVSQVYTDRIQPPLPCTLERRTLGGLTVLVIEVPMFDTQRPFRANGTYYIRDANRSREASREELRRLLESHDYHYDEQSIAGASFEDLSIDTIRTFIGQAYGEHHLATLFGGEDRRRLERFLINIHCLDELAKPTVTGLLFFGFKPQQFLLDARITATRVRGTTFSPDILSRADIDGRILDQLDRAFEFLQATTPSPAHIAGVMRVETGLPETVFREALLNALVHRDYRMASQIRVFVFDDRVEIINPGTLLNRLNVESIRAGGLSQKRNPVIASLMARARRLEGSGFGIPDMVSAMLARGLPEPEIIIEGGHFRLILRLAAEASS